MNLVYNVNEKPKISEIIVCAFQQLLAIIPATVLVPVIVGNGMSQAAALFGAGAGTLIYILFTKAKSPVFLGSSFAFLGSMSAAFAGAISTAMGYFGLVLGAVFAGLVYVALALVVKFCGVGWINKLMPAVVIGPTVAIIGLGLAGNAITDLNSLGYRGLVAGIVALLVTVIASVYGKKVSKMIPFIIGIGAGYVVSLVLHIVDFSTFSNMTWVPDFTFMAMKSIFADKVPVDYVLTILVAYVPVAFVVFAEHIADHKNLSTIIGHDLLEEPGLTKTLLGDGVGSMVGAFFGGCPNTSYGEAVACVGISGNASVYVTITTAIMCIVSSFIAPFTAFLATIPTPVMGGVEALLYGFIAVSGLKSLQTVDLNDNKNLFTAAIILVAGIGGLTLTFGQVTITSVACALILGIIVNTICNRER